MFLAKNLNNCYEDAIVLARSCVSAVVLKTRAFVIVYSRNKSKQTTLVAKPLYIHHESLHCGIDCLHLSLDIPNSECGKSTTEAIAVLQGWQVCVAVERGCSWIGTIVSCSTYIFLLLTVIHYFLFIFFQDIFQRGFGDSVATSRLYFTVLLAEWSAPGRLVKGYHSSCLMGQHWLMTPIRLSTYTHQEVKQLGTKEEKQMLLLINVLVLNRGCHPSVMPWNLQLERVHLHQNICTSCSKKRIPMHSFESHWGFERYQVNIT